MPRTALTVTTTDRDGVAPVAEAADATNGNQFTNDQKTLVRVLNGDAVDHVVHIPTTKTVDGKNVKDIVVTVPANTGDLTFGPFSNANYGTSGVVAIDIYNASGPTLDADDEVSGGTKEATGVTIETWSLGSVG